MTLADAARTPWEAVVIGAGPAGSVAARGLALARMRTLLVDRSAFPRPKVCGCCLNGRALATLDQVGLGNLVAGQGGQPLTSFLLGGWGQSARVGLPAGVVLSRQRFDAALVAEATAAGATLLTETHATAGRLSASCRTVELRQGEQSSTVSANVVIAADGLNGRALGGSPSPSVARSRVGAGTVLAEAPAFYRPGTIHMACGAGGYVGCVRLEDGRLDLAAAFDPAFLRVNGSPGDAASRLLKAAGWPVPNGIASGWRGTPALTRSPAIVSAERAFAVGDAAGYVEPFTGEGMAWALATGVGVVPLAVEAARGWRPALAEAWQREHRHLVGRRQLSCRLLTLALRRPLMVRVALSILRWIPAVAAPLVRDLNQPRLAPHPV